jgi:histidinol phosphatase-like PHP family hydrolase
VAIEINLSQIIKGEELDGPLAQQELLSKLAEYNCLVSLGSDLHSMDEVRDRASKINGARWLALSRILNKMSTAGIQTNRLINTYPLHKLKNG